MFKQIHKSVGPILISAFSLLLCISIIKFLSIGLNLPLLFLSRKGLGKITFISMVVYQIILFMLTLPQPFVVAWYHRCFRFLFKEPWIPPFARFFIAFFVAHILVLYAAFLTGFVEFNNAWGTFSASLGFKLLIGFFVVFLLAWTEELIFRGTLYFYFARFFSPLTSAVIASCIFSLSHNLASVTTLLTSQWRLGLGLFLLGLLFNLIFIATDKLYYGMGAHAGLVFVKVILRRIPVIACETNRASYWLFAEDLRQAYITHIMLLSAIIGIIWFLKKQKN